MSPPDPAPVSHRGRAFGLEIESTFTVPGLATSSGAGHGPVTRLELASPEEVDRDWVSDASSRLMEERFDDETEAAPARTIDAHEGVGYRLYARHFGLARISWSGDSVLCAPPAGMADWSWQRFLVGRVLPWASVLQGYEALHASAVEIDGRAAAFIGPTGWGKTSLALRLVASGAGFVADDVLALEPTEAGLTAHPGSTLACVRPAEQEVIPSSTWERLGKVLGHSGKTYLAVPASQGPLPLGAVFFLSGGDGPPLEPMPSPDPRLLLSSTFVFGIQRPERLQRQLDVCAAIANRVQAYRLRVTAGLDAGALAEVVSSHLSASPVR
jgi:hypothetical protein